MIADNTTSAGFTIVELMISTAIFSVVLLIISYALITIGRQFYKADTSSTTQNAARLIIEDVGRQVQLGAKSPTIGTSAGDGTQAYCIDSIRYSYLTQTQVEDVANAAKHQGLHALWRDNIKNTQTCNAINLTTSTADGNSAPNSGKELIPNHVRLLNFSISNNANGIVNPSTADIWDLDVNIIYGDDDSLKQPSLDTCELSNAGGAFCAPSEAHTAVFRRLN